MQYEIWVSPILLYRYSTCLTSANSSNICLENIDFSIAVSANLARAIRESETKSECSAKTNEISCKEQLMFCRKHSKKKLYHNR